MYFNTIILCNCQFTKILVLSVEFMIFSISKLITNYVYIFAIIKIKQVFYTAIFQLVYDVDLASYREHSCP